jgi:CRISPR/Cas system-associated exonuclease Cas4 (RecB family)
VKGRARYLVEVSPSLGRALRTRFLRWSQSTWTPADGLVKPGATGRTALEGHQLGARPFSPTSLEQFAGCPYKFYLSTVLRLSALEIPGEIEELGPLEKGSMTHEVHFLLLSRLRDEGLAVRPATLDTVFARLDGVIAEVTARFRDDFVPAIARVWDDGVETMRADQREWLRRVAADTEWEPWRFELAFGLGQRDQQDPSSVPKPVQLDNGLQVRGSIDLVERRVGGGALRATDYKTGRAWAEEGNVVGGGQHLQPVLYAMVLEKLFPDQKVESGRLFYCTQVGGFGTVGTPLDTLAREHLGRVVRAIRGALEQGFFPAMPGEGECRWCDFKAVCGPEEERRVRLTRKALRAESLELVKVRQLP